MKRYRYRTATLVGPWRDSRLKAETDAISVRLALIEPETGKFVWRVYGEIETGEGHVNGRESGQPAKV